MSNRQDQEREAILQPERIDYAKSQILQRGLEILEEDNTKIIFLFKGNRITVFPYSGWFSGRGITSGRGIDKLLRQLK